MRPGAAFSAADLRRPARASWRDPVEHASGIVTTGVRDAGQHRPEDMAWDAGAASRTEPIGDWGHPRGPEMLAGLRLGAP